MVLRRNEGRILGNLLCKAVMKRILLTGATGRLGSELLQGLNSSYEVCAPTRAELPLSPQTDFYSFFQQTKPHTVVNSGALSDVDYCESHPEEAEETNVLAPQKLAEACRKLNIRLIHISSDYVFSGEKGSPYTEEDEIGGNPNFYGQTKEGAEKAILKANPEAILLRVAWLYGKKGPDFVSSIMDKLRAGSTRIQAVEDQFGSPTSIADLCTHIPYFIERDNVNGVFQLVNEGCVSRLEMAKVIADEFGSVCEVCGVTSKNFPRPAKRPKNTSLRSLRLQEAKLPPMPNWEASLREFVRKNQKAPE